MTLLDPRPVLPVVRSAAAPDARPRRYADVFVEWLVELGYTHCFFVAGGASMHLLDAVRTRLTCVPFVHEVSAGIAAEYACEMPGDARPFVLVTAGPGLTNLMTALSGAWLESRELLVVGGQVKSSDLATDGLRQRGIQEVDGVTLAGPTTKAAVRLTAPAPQTEIQRIVELGCTGRKGPVFIEVCLDVQGAPMTPETETRLVTPPVVLPRPTTPARPAPTSVEITRLLDLVRAAQRPVVLLGGGVSRAAATAARPGLAAGAFAVMTTWNGADRVPADLPSYAGRPNTWGQRGANALLAQADLVIALGTRLGLQQTGFAWEDFTPIATLVQVDLDMAELTKGHPRVDLPLRADADEVLGALCGADLPRKADWLDHCREVRGLLPLRDPANTTADGFVCPYEFSSWLSAAAPAEAALVPCSSGGANSVPMQALELAAGHTLISDKGLASMGYGLAGAIGAALAAPERPVVLIEGDGGFSQNLSELGTVAAQGLDIAIFLFCNDGYGSIRTTQRNYFGGAYLGCDTRTGLGLPDWERLFAAYDIPCAPFTAADLGPAGGARLLRSGRGPRAYLVPIDPDQTYWPKISSEVTATGGMRSRPLHDMSPDLSPDLARRVLRHLPEHLLPPYLRTSNGSGAP